MTATERTHDARLQPRRVYRSINKPLTILGVERRLFFLALVMSGATFNFFGSLFGGGAMFALLYGFGLWASVHDPEILRIALNSAKQHASYDPSKRSPEIVR